MCVNIGNALYMAGYNMIQTPTLTQPPPAILKPSTEAGT